MKVLLATDGSPEDQQAIDFLAAPRWPAGTEIELFGVMRPVSLAVPGVFIESRGRDFPHELEHLATNLPAGEAVVTWRCAVGEPVEMITARACVRSRSRRGRFAWARCTRDERLGIGVRRRHRPRTLPGACSPPA